MNQSKIINKYKKILNIGIPYNPTDNLLIKLIYEN